MAAGLQAGLALSAAIVLTLLSPWSHMVGFTALGALASLFGRYALIERRTRFVLIAGALLTTGVCIPSLASYAGAPGWLMVLTLALVAGISTLATSYWQLGAPGAVIIVFAAGGAQAQATSLHVLLERIALTIVGVILAWIVCRLTDRLRASELRTLHLPATPHRPLNHELIAASRIALGAAIAALIAYGAGWQHPAWAAIGTTAVMQGGHLHVTMNRALQRMAGTIIGAGILWLVLAMAPSFWVLVATIVVFQFITEIIIGYNYALGQITVTPMALLMTYLASPATATNMPVERILDTMLGAVLGIIFAVIFSTMDDRIYLAKLRLRNAGKR